MPRSKPYVDEATEERRRKAREYAKKYREEHPEFAIKDRKRAAIYGQTKAYGLSEDQFEKMLLDQNFSCAVCGDSFTNEPGLNSSRDGKPHVDHDHTTGRIRGLLCHQCNSMLGFSRDNEFILRQAVAYLDANDSLKSRRGWSGNITGKVWGETATLMVTPMIEIHRIKVKPNAQCSLHEHKFKNNTFIVLTGRLLIDVHKNDYDLVDTTELLEGNMFTASPGEYHRFRTESEGAEAFEVYHLGPLTQSDIVRKDAGSVFYLEDTEFAND